MIQSIGDPFTVHIRKLIFYFWKSFRFRFIGRSCTGSECIHFTNWSSLFIWIGFDFPTCDRIGHCMGYIGRTKQISSWQKFCYPSCCSVWSHHRNNRKYRKIDPSVSRKSLNSAQKPNIEYRSSLHVIF